MITITKIFTFDSAHFLPHHEGKCRNTHGHTFTLEIELNGREIKQEGSETGMIMDFGVLKKIVEMKVVNTLDHHCINDVLENPTAENLVIWIRDQLRIQFPSLIRVRVYETRNSYAEWRE